MSAKISLTKGRKELKEIIETCKAIEKRRFNPFFLDVGLAVKTLRTYYPRWEKREDMILDAEAVQNLSKVLMLQNTQLLYQSSKLYGDPKLIQDKIKKSSVRDLALKMLRSTHPILELEQLTVPSIEHGLEYWRDLKPFHERIRSKSFFRGESPNIADLTDLARSGVLQLEDFTSLIEQILKELNEECDSEGSVDYWSFIKRGSFSETVERAYIVSLLVSYGTLEMKVEGDPNQSGGIKVMRRRTPVNKRKMISFPITLE